MLAICAASVLLHGLAIGWVGTQFGPGMEGIEEPPDTQTVVATLIAAPEPVPVPVPVPVPAPTPAVAAPAAPPPKPAQPAMPTPVQHAAALEDAAPVEAIATPPIEEIAAQPLPQPALALEQLAPQTIAAPDSAAAVPRYRVSLPPSVRLSFEVARKEANGTEWSGSSEMDWQRGSDSYRLSMDAFVNMLVTRVNVGRVNSEGVLTEDGIAPRRVTEKRMGRAETATHFDAAGQRITFSSSERSVPLLPGAQDKASVQFQLAGIARADSAQLTPGVEIQVGSERDAAPYRFVVAGEEEIDTPMGRIATLRLTRPPRPGSYNARLDIWLAPQHGWLPVKVRSAESKGAVTTQTIRSIVATDAGNG